MKSLKIGEKEVKICEHQGDISYLRFVKFKQYAPQFWEKMDSPLFVSFFERYMEYHNQGKHAQALMVLHDYKMSIDMSKNSYDAWGICFALICIEEGEDFRACPDDSDLIAKVHRLNGMGLTALVVKEEVLNFMVASPEAFTDHLTLHRIASLPTETLK